MVETSCRNILQRMQRNIFGNASDFLKEKCCTTLLWCTGLSQSMPLRSRRASFLPIFDCCFLSNTRTVISRYHSSSHVRLPTIYCGRRSWVFLLGTPHHSNQFSCSLISLQRVFGWILGLSLHRDYDPLWPIMACNSGKHPWMCGCVDMIGYVWESPGSD